MFELYKIKFDKSIYDITFSDNGNLGVTSDCAYVFDQSGYLLNKICGKYGMHDASYCCGRFGFINSDFHAYITDQNGNLIKKVYVGDKYYNAITMTEDGFVACRRKCALFDFNGNKLWDVNVGRVENGPSYYKGYWYVADWGLGKLLIIKDGKIIKKIHYGKIANDTAVCGKYLAVSTEHHLYLYDISDPENPKEIWKVGGFNVARQVAFYSNCRHIAVTDKYNKKLKIYNINGDLLFEMEYKEYVISVTTNPTKDYWIVVGTEKYLHVNFIPPPIHCFG